MKIDLHDFNLRIRTLQLVNHVLMIYGIIAVALGWITPWYLLAGFLTYLWFGTIGVCVGLHRYFSHRSFKTSKFWHVFLALSGTLTTVGSVIGWVGLHRYHHLNTDTDEDPHDPRRIGILRAWFYFWKPSKFTKKYIRTELQDPVLVFMHRHYFKIIFAYIALLAVINPWLVIWCYCLPACGAYHGISAVTVIGHMHGYKSQDVNDQSRNSWIACLLSCGEGWHNNHHARAGSHRQGFEWWELDPPAWVIENILIKK